MHVLKATLFSKVVSLKVMDAFYTSFFKRILFCIIVFSGQFAQAQVVKAGEFFWKHKQADTYELGLSLYRPCGGALLDSIQTIEIIATDLTPNDSLFIDLKKVSSDFISFHCDTLSNICGELGTLDSANQGIEKQVFTAIIDFSQGKLSQLTQSGACVFRFYFQNYQRALISTVDTSQKLSSFTVDAEMNLCGINQSYQAGSDNSPIFTTPPLTYNFCSFSSFSYHDGGFDVDMDSVVYSLEEPLWNKHEALTYVTNYSKLFPVRVYCRMGTPTCNCRSSRLAQGFCFDPFFGSYLYTPTNCGESALIVVKATQYKLDSTGQKWIYAGYTKREFNLKTLEDNSMNNTPVLFDISYPTICEGERVCVTVRADDEFFMSSNNTQSRKDTIQLAWNQVFMDATFELDSVYTSTTNGVTVENSIATLCVQTKIGDASPSPYIFSITATDKYCPYNAVSAKAYAFLVKPVPEFKMHITGNSCGKYQLQLNSVKKFPYRDSIIASWKVLNDQDQVVAEGNKTSDSFKLNKFGTYIVQTTAYHFKSNCNIQTLDTLYFAPDSIDGVFISPIIHSNDTLQCFKELRFDLSGSSIIQNDSVDTQFWTFSTLETDTFWGTTVSKRLDTVGVLHAFFHVTSNLGCMEKVAKQLVVVQNPIASPVFEDTVLCFNHHLFVGKIGSNDSQAQFMQYHWSFSDSPDSVFSGTVVQKNFPNPAIYEAQLVAIDSNYCSDTASLFLETLPVIPAKISVVDSGEYVLCSPAKMIFNAQIDTPFNAFVSGYLWEFSSQSFASDSVVESSFNADTGHFAQLITVASNGCSDTSIYYFDVFQPPHAYFELSDTAVCPNIEVQFFADSTMQSNQFIWKVNTVFLGNGPSNIFDAEMEGYYKVQLVVESKEHCTDTAYRNLTVYPNPETSIHMLSAAEACSNEAAFEMLDSSTIAIGKIENNRWYYTDTFVLNADKLLFSPSEEGSYLVFLEAISNQGCTAMDSIELRVLHTPAALPIIGDTLFFVGDTIVFQVQEDLLYSYKWKHTAPLGYHLNFNNQPIYTVVWTDTGKAEVSYSVYADPACADSAFLNVYVKARSLTSHVPPALASQLNCYPNPVVDKLMLPEWENISNLSIYNHVGKLMLSTNPAPELDLSFLSPGTYFVEGKAPNGTTFRRRIVKITP